MNFKSLIKKLRLSDQLATKNSVSYTEEVKELLNKRSYPNYTEIEIKKLLRDLKIDTLSNSINLDPDLSKLSKEIVEKCKILSQQYNMVIGGSVVLKVCGLLEHRNIDDIDVFCSIKEAKEYNLIKSEYIINHTKEYDSNVERYKVNLPDLGKLDIFDKKEKVFTQINGINFANPIITLEEKFKYFREKDKMDFYLMRKNLNYI